MSHTAADVSVVECGTDGLGCLVGRVDHAGDVGHGDKTASAPVLEGEILDVTVPGTL